MVAAAERAGIVTQVGFMYRFGAAISQAQADDRQRQGGAARPHERTIFLQPPPRRVVGEAKNQAASSSNR